MQHVSFYNYYDFVSSQLFLLDFYIAIGLSGSSHFLVFLFYLNSTDTTSLIVVLSYFNTFNLFVDANGLLAFNKWLNRTFMIL